MAHSAITVDRRGMLGALAAAPVAIAIPATALAQHSPDRSAWDGVVAKYKAISAQVDRNSVTLRTVHDAAEAACPRRDEFFSRYNMGCGWSRQANYRSASMSLVIERAKGRHSTPEEAKQIAADANRLVDEFEAWCAHHDEVFAEYDALQEAFDHMVDEETVAFNAVIETAAPDNEALLYKIELLATVLDEGASEDADSLAAIRTDARRLLSRGRA